MAHVLIVSRDYYSTEKLAAALEKRGVRTSRVYRSYNFDPSLDGVDVVVSDGTCKAGDGFGHSMPVPFDEPREAALDAHKPFLGYASSLWDTPSDAVIEQRAQEVLAAIPA